MTGGSRSTARLRLLTGEDCVRVRAAAFRLLAEHNGDQLWVAAQLSIHPTTLYRWRKRPGPAGRLHAHLQERQGHLAARQLYTHS